MSEDDENKNKGRKKRDASSVCDALASAFLMANHVFFVNEKQWRFWGGTHYNQCFKSNIRNKIREFLKPSQRNPKNINAIYDIVEMQSVCENESFCTMYRQDGPWLRINFPNCILCINEETGERTTEPHHTEWNFTEVIPTNYNPEADCPKYKAHLEKCVPSEKNRNVILSLLSTIFIPDARFEKILLLIGEGGSGKSTLITPVITALDGDRRKLTSALSMHSLCDEKRQETISLRRSILNVATEMSTKGIFDTSAVKAIASGEAIPTNYKWESPGSERYCTKLVFLMNTLPFIKGTSADTRRCIAIPFPEPIPEEERNEKLRFELAEEAEGILALILSYLPDTLQKGIPVGDEESEELMNRVSLRITPNETFLQKYIVRTKGKQLIYIDILRQYREFLIDQGLSSNMASLMNQFTNEARDRGLLKIDKPEYRTIDGKRKWVTPVLNRAWKDGKPPFTSRLSNSEFIMAGLQPEETQEPKEEKSEYKWEKGL